MSTTVHRLLVAALLAIPALDLHAGDLPPGAGDRIERTHKKLEAVADAFESGDATTAKAWFDAAASDVENLARRFDEIGDHPDYRALQRSLADWKVKLAAGATAKKDDGPKLDSRAAYQLRQLDRPLTSAEKAIGAGDLSSAKTFLEQASDALDRLGRDYDVDPAHPDVARARERIESLRGHTGAVGAAQAADEAVLPALLDALKQASERVAPALAEAERHLRDLSSARHDYGKDRDASRFAPLIERAGLAAERIHDVLPTASDAAAAFLAQYPDPYALGRRLPAARGADRVVAHLRETPESWRSYRGRYADEFLEDATSLIERYEGELAAPPSDDTLRKVLIHRADEAVAYADALLRAVRAVHPGEKDDPRVARAAALDARAEKVSTAAARLAGDVAAAAARRLQDARFPATELAGGEWRDVEARMTRAFESFAPGQRIRKIAVSAPWDERTEARWRGRWIVGTYRYVGGYVAADLEDGGVRVYSLSFRKTRQADGGYGPLEVFGVGQSYRMLAENL